MNPSLRNTLVALISIPLAAWMGWEIAEGSYFWPALVGAVCTGAVIARVTGHGVDTVFTGMLLIGYVVGSRGFAQLMPAPGVPLLPAEIGLLIGGVWVTLRSALERKLPFRRDPLNVAVFLWILVGTVRVAFDVRSHGLLAMRDFAQVYYAGYFFIVQALAQEPKSQRFLTGALIFAAITLLPVFGLYTLFPEFFLTQLVLLGSPVIFFKGDIVYTFLTVGALVLFHWADGAHRRWAWPVACVLFFATAAGDNRASIVGGAFACVLLLRHRHWKFPALQAALVLAGLFVVFGLAQAGNPWAERKLDAIRDRVVSMVDFSGGAAYRSEESGFKGDNNRFRLVWWETVIKETVANNPVFGLGFGYDLAVGFVRTYYPSAGDEFTTRSPHNFFVTTFGRLGVIGVVMWGTICVLLFRLSTRVLARPEGERHWGLAVAPWVVLVASCFGVVLEGPMGAVPFWIMVGLLHAEANQPRGQPVESPA
jgi:hypothetical protein